MKNKKCEIENCRGCDYQKDENSFLDNGFVWSVISGLVVGVILWLCLLLEFNLI